MKLRAKAFCAALGLVLAAGCKAGSGRSAASTGPCVPRTTPSFERAPSGIHEVDVAWLTDHRCGIRLIDVRSEDELTGDLGRIDGIEWTPLETLGARATAWSSDEPIVVVCRSGRRAARAVEQLEEAGFQRVAALTGGMLAWHMAGLPVTRAPLRDHATSSSARASERVSSMLRDESRIHWTSVASIIGSASEQCIDGRSQRARIATPGGDAGELVLVLAALETSAHIEVTGEKVASLLRAYTGAFGRYYLHTDLHSMNRLGAALRGDPRFEGPRNDGSLTPDRLESFVRRPPAAFEGPLLSYLTMPEHVGCGHLRSMLERPAAYGVRADLVRSVLRASFEVGWRHPELLDFEVLEGDHVERAVVRVWLDHPIHPYTRVPTIAARPGDSVSFFVAHPEVSAYLRRELGSFLSEELARGTLGVAPRLDDVPSFQRELDALAERQMATTLRTMAGGLPVYDLHRGDGVQP